jgi:murein L,D-transpeptidase YafK
VTGVMRWVGVVGALLVLGAASVAMAGDVITAPSDGVAGEVIAPAPDGSDGYAGPLIEIWKAQRTLQLRRGDSLIGQFRVALGQQPRYGKETQGDGRTPVGRYYISDKNAGSRFHRFLGISYPNVDDAERGYRRRLIDANEWADIFFANLRGDAPPSRTVLGGRVGIHGYGGRPYLPIDWTEGCIAVSDDDIEFIYDRVSVGTPVIINE